MKHASFPCDLFNISKMIGYRHEIVRLPVVFQRRRLQVFVKNRTHQSRRFCQQHTDPIRYTPICEQSRSPCFVLLADRATKLFGITLNCDKHNTSDIHVSTSISTRKKKHVPFFLVLMLMSLVLCLSHKCETCF